MRRDRLLKEAGRILCEREARYGNPQDCFSRIKDGWNWWLRCRKGELTEIDVAVMMAILKLARIANDSRSSDSWLDGISYLVLGASMGANDE